MVICQQLEPLNSDIPLWDNPAWVIKHTLCHSKKHWDTFLVLIILCYWFIDYKSLTFTHIKNPAKSYIPAHYLEK